MTQCDFSPTSRLSDGVVRSDNSARSGISASLRTILSDLRGVGVQEVAGVLREVVRYRGRSRAAVRHAR